MLEDEKARKKIEQTFNAEKSASGCNFDDYLCGDVRFGYIAGNILTEKHSTDSRSVKLMAC